VGLHRQQPHQHGTGQVQHRQDLLRRKEPIGDDAEEEGRDQRRHGGGAIGEAHLAAREPERLAQVGSHGDEPCSPDEVLEKHHHRQPYTNAHARSPHTPRADIAPEVWVSYAVIETPFHPAGSGHSTASVDGIRTSMQIRAIRSAETLSRVVAAHAAAALTRVLAAQAVARIVAATGSSQLKFLERLVATGGIDWSRVELFHLDEYIGLPQQHPGSFSHFIEERIVRPTGIAHAHLLDGSADPYRVIDLVGRELLRASIDVAFTGIGENGHLAFNEPPADFETDKPFALVALDDISRRQQVGEGWFETVADVPTHAITM